MSLNSHRNLGMTGTQQARSAQRLSSGYRINSAADDAAGLGISETMRAQIRGLDQASRNAQDGISLIQTAEGALSTVNEMVTRIRELVVQSGNDTNTADDRLRLQDEIDQLKEEITDVSLRTEFNTMTLLDGPGGVLADLATSIGNGIGSDNITNAEEAQMFADLVNAINSFNDVTGWGIDSALDSTQLAALNDVLTELGNVAASGDHTDLSALETALGVLNGGIPGYGGLTLPPTTTEEADAFMNAVREIRGFELRMTGGNEFNFQIGANADQQISVQIGNMSWESISSGLQIDLELAENEVGELLNRLDATLGAVTSQRSALGAVQNRLEYTIQNLDISSENLQAAESRIRDADMAREMMSFTQSNVLQQAAISMLAQANSAPQSILQLLG